MMRRLVMISLCLSVTVMSVPAWAAPVRPVVTLDGALQQADANQPALHQAHAAVEAAQARTDQSRSSMLPQVSVGTGYTQGPQRSAFGNAGSNNFSTNVSADQVLYSFGQDWDKWKAASSLADSQAASERATLEQVHMNVRTAYFAARAAQVMVQVQQDTLTNQQRHLNQIKGFVDAGTRPPIDLVTAQRDVANARVQLIDAQNGYETAKAQLNQAMGVEAGTDFDVTNLTMPAVPGEDQSLDALMSEAQQDRPEFASSAAQVQAQQLTVSSIKAGELPSFHLATGIGEVGSQFNGMGTNWDVGVTMSWPVFSGGSLQAQQHEAEANLSGIQAQRDSLRQQVRLEVEQARLSVKAEKAAVSAAAESTRSAKEQLNLAEGRYTAGVGSIIELGDAQLALTNAQAQEVQENFKLASARAQLDKALGRN